MRKFEFRAWDKDKEEMFNVLVIDWLNKLIDLEYGNIERELEDIILMQYTGILDKNNVEIYEGDIVEFDDVFEFEPNKYQTIENMAVVKFKDGCFYLDDFKIYAEASRELERNKITKVTSVKFVIGNIYENPELLE